MAVLFVYKSTLCMDTNLQHWTCTFVSKMALDAPCFSRNAIEGPRVKRVGKETRPPMIGTSRGVIMLFSVLESN